MHLSRLNTLMRHKVSAKMSDFSRGWRFVRPLSAGHFRELLRCFLKGLGCLLSRIKSLLIGSKSCAKKIHIALYPDE